MVKHKHGKSYTPLILPVFVCVMNGIVLFLILHIFTGTKDINSSKKKHTELKYRYPIGHKAS